MQSSITQLVGSALAGAAIVAVTVAVTWSRAFAKGEAKGWCTGYFQRELDNKRRRDAAGKFRTMEAD